jgi:hypothetical protein
MAPRAVSTTSVTLAPENITPDKRSTLFAVFVKPAPASGLDPRIVAITEGGRKLPIQLGRPYRRREAGQAIDRAAAFFQAGHPGPVTILVAGQKQTTGLYTVETTLPGDVNGDGQVNLADLVPFAQAYVSKPADPDYNAAADYNQNGIVNFYDALAMERNMTPLTPSMPVKVALNLAPSDQVHYSAPKTSGGQTFEKDVTLNGYTTPGSIVLEDRSAGDYTFGGGALATDARGFFSGDLKNSSGINTYDFKVLDPFGHQSIRSFPVFWIRYAAPGSKIGGLPG